MQYFKKETYFMAKLHCLRVVNILQTISRKCLLFTNVIYDVQVDPWSPGEHQPQIYSEHYGNENNYPPGGISSSLILLT